MQSKRLLILGVTASGKSRLGFDLARTLETDVISIDSMKVYRRMDIGTAKPSRERRQQVHYHLIDVVEPSESYSVGMFLDQAQHAIDTLESADKPVVAVGGTALYIKSLMHGLFEGPAADHHLRNRLHHQAQTEGLDQLHRELTQVDPTAAARINPNDARRIVRALEVYHLTGKPISSFQTQFNADNQLRHWCIVGLRRDKARENRRINARVKNMVSAGLFDEVRALLAEDRPLSKQAAAAIGYAEVIAHLQGRMDAETAVEKIKIHTRRLAKSQRTWFKTFTQAHWIDVPPDATPESIRDQVLDLWQTGTPSV